MKRNFLKIAFAAAWPLACAPAFGAPAAGDPAAIPVEAFFENPLLTQPILSPSGDALAVQMRVNGHRVLAVIDTATMKKVAVIARFQDTDVGNAKWVSDKRLVFDQEFENGITRYGAWHGLWAVDRDGSNQRQLIRADGEENRETGSYIKSRTLTADYYLRSTIRDGSDDVIIEKEVDAPAIGGINRYHAERLYTLPKRLDTRTGQLSSIVEGNIPEHSQGWVIDDLGHVKAVFTLQDGEEAVLAPKDGAWKDIARFQAYDTHADRIADVIASVDGHLYLARGGNGPGRTSALYRFDPARWQSDAEPVVSIKGFDFDGDLVEDHCTHKVLGLHYDSDALGTAWLDPAMAAAQAKIDAALPGRVNIVQVASCASGTPLLVTSTSDRAPEQYFLYGPGDAGLRSVSESRPTIDPRQMADTDFYRIKARDGREFPVYVTRPHGKGPWPTVVLVHGGPNARGWSWEWDDESQFLASRGYLVVKPEFRGSAGYGTELEAAGFRQWGLATQDDIADATRWAAAQGWSDAKRTCIAGASFGGYATLMGLIRYPELYRCGIAYSAVADIGMMYETWWSDLSDDWKGYGMPVTVGDREKDAAQFIATSPLKLAARIKQPLLLTHGGHDQRVPIEQATAMHDALEAAHAPVTWVYYPEECHGFCIQKDRFDFYRRMEAFLAANIGAAATNASAN